MESADESAARENDDYDYCEGVCQRCDGEGLVMICPDDLCRGSGECMMGRSGPGCFKTCPDCKGEG